MVSSEPSALSRGNPLDANSFYKHNYAYAQLDGKSTKFGLENRGHLYITSKWIQECLRLSMVYFVLLLVNMLLIAFVPGHYSRIIWAFGH
jgi:hypothetical protein